MDSNIEQIIHTFQSAQGESNVSISVTEFLKDPVHSIAQADAVIATVERVLIRLKEYRSRIGVSPVNPQNRQKK